MMTTGRRPVTKREITQSHCNRCGGQRNHAKIASERQEYKDWVEGNDRNWECFDSWEMLNVVAVVQFI